MFSVVIPLYNKGALVKRAIDSVLSQDIDEEVEVLVVDDGSTDGSYSYVEEYEDKRVRLIRKQNGGVSSARNKGIEEAKYERIMLLDADDEFLQGTLAAYKELADRYPDVHFFITQQNSRYTSNGLFERIHLWLFGKIKRTRHPFFWIWMRLFYPTPGIVCFSRDLSGEKGLFDTRMSFYEDIDFMIRMMKNEEIAYCSIPTMTYYQEETGLSGSSHPIEKEMAYYIPEYVETASFWHKALLYENIEMEILWWQQHGNEENVKFYHDMQKKYFSRVYSLLHWLRQKMIRRGLI